MTVTVHTINANELAYAIKFLEAAKEQITEVTTIKKHKSTKALAHLNVDRALSFLKTLKDEELV